ncbi:Uncharacterised protein [Mycobacteroides abscessus subsp. abscessus]|nr:Uncharacterised protein [Mycobacteroides abscessus subsp. abscessus]SKR03803.1 Uncharacterised protein [Mycobacteroides abscessus subsp. abscessus]
MLGAMGSWEAVVEETAVAMVCAAAGRSGSATLGILGRTGPLAFWCCSVGWWACCWPAGLPEVVLGDLALGAVGVPDGPLPEMRLERVGFTACGAAEEVGVPGTLVDSVVGVVVARGISGSWCGSGAGA